MDSDRRKLVRVLRAAYSGEMAAAFAYRAHWKSLGDFSEKEAVYRIEDEEWAHRREIRRMLEALGSRPQKIREMAMWLTGRVIGLGCYFTGRFMPMYFAGLLEHGNVKEYDAACLYAERLGLKSFEDELRQMALTERSHELFFISALEGHRLTPFMRAVFRWG
ncbi:MAG TPA: ferritin-like domain-containing protein [Pyrinomonadaceae bacterium]|nr:ferritin-like domain-containing protein [Pyrinomonadaceae bacterium]